MGHPKVTNSMPRRRCRSDLVLVWSGSFKDVVSSVSTLQARTPRGDYLDDIGLSMRNVLRRPFSILYVELRHVSSLLKQTLENSADHFDTLMRLGYFILISNGNCYNVVLFLLFTDHNYYNNNYEFTCQVSFKETTTWSFKSLSNCHLC